MTPAVLDSLSEIRLQLRSSALKTLRRAAAIYADSPWSILTHRCQQKVSDSLGTAPQEIARAARGRAGVVGVAILEKPIRLFVMVRGDEIIVTSETGFRAAYFKRPNKPLLKLKRLTGTEDYELLAQAWRPQTTRRASWGGLCRGYAAKSPITQPIARTTP
jgi:hypothetical protein